MHSLVPMRRSRVAIVRNSVAIALCAVAGVGWGRPTTPVEARPATPAPTSVLVELFTSEGCSSCPPADALLAQLVATPVLEGVRIVALGEHVDYWDELGWKDRFSSPAFTNRQQVYASRLSAQGAYTPQLVVDGRSECVGSDATAAKRAIARAAGAPHGRVAIDLDGLIQNGGVHVVVTVTDLPQQPADRADIVVAITEDGLQTRATRGENRGRTLSHVAVVRLLTTIGEAVGPSGRAERELSIPADWQPGRLNIVAFAQQRRSRQVLASVVVPLVPRS